MKNIEITLFSIDAEARGVSYPYIGISEIVKFELSYIILMRDKYRTIQSDERETYEEALRALREPSTVLEQPCNSEVLQKKPVCPDIRAERRAGFVG